MKVCPKCNQSLGHRRGISTDSRKPRTSQGTSRIEWANKTALQIRIIVSHALPRWEKQLLGKLITEKGAARKVVDDLIAYIVEKTGGDADKLERPHIKECRNLICEAFRESRMDTAEVSLCKLMMERMMPALQHVEHKVDITQTNIVVLPEEKSEKDWGKVIEHQKRLQ